MTKRIAHRALDYALSTPWSIRREALELMIAIALRENRDPEAIAAEAGKPLANTRAVTVRDGVATIPVEGPLFKKANIFSEISGATSYEELATDLTAALADPEVTAVLLAVDSPGGEVNGAAEMSELIYRSRGAKPIVAHIGGLGTSAAYWLASAADRVVVAETALIGNIGVVMTMTDDRGAENPDGSVDVQFVSSQSPHKLPDPATKDGRARIQAVVDQLAAVFIANVARNRGTTEANVEKNFGQGDVIVGKAAVGRGMVNGVGTFEAVHRSLARRTAATPGVLRSAPVPAPRRAAPVGLVAALAGAVATLRIATPVASSPLAKTLEIFDEFLTAERASAEADDPIITIELPKVPEGDSPAPGPVAVLQPATAAAQREEGMNEAEVAAAARESERRAGLMDLASEHELPASRAKGWIEKNFSVDAASREIAAEYKAGARPVIVPGAEAGDAAARAAAKGIKVHDREGDKPFAAFGDQLTAIIRAGAGKGIHPRLRSINHQALKLEAAPSGMDESVGSEGGFFIQPDLLPGIIDPVYTEDPILSRVQRIPISGNGVKFNVVDEISRVTGSRWGAIQMYWVNEADTASAKKPKLRQVALDLKKLMGIGYLTDELVEDAPASQALMIRAFRTELGFMLGDAVFRGLGGGQPLGIMKSGALVTQAIEGTQTIANSNQFVSANIAKMLARVPASLWGEVIFLYNQELLNTFVNATIGTSSAVPLFIPIGGLSGKPSDTLLGRPALASELCEAVGTPGDLLVVAPSQYIIGDKGGVNQATSLHVRFLNDEMALRITYRVDGTPIWYTTLTPYKGANVRSPFVALNTRS